MTSPRAIELLEILQRNSISPYYAIDIKGKIDCALFCEIERYFVNMKYLAWSY